MIETIIKINGLVVGNVYCHMKGFIHKDNESDLCEYSWEYHPQKYPGILRGYVRHHRNEGDIKLLSLVYEAILKEMK